MKVLKILAISGIAFLFSLAVFAQQNDTSVIVQPGAPGEMTKVLPSGTSAKLPPFTKADVDFMQGMIHHHQQAVDMVALMRERTKNDELLNFGARIGQTQTEEIKFMKRWLTSRGQKTSMQMMKMDKMKMPKTGSMKMDKMKMEDHSNHQMAMPGMLTPKQMKALSNAKGNEFDKLFLTGMIQHHEGALVMVDDLFKAQGAGQDAEMFAFATDVDGTQRAEIKIMKTMLEEKP